MISDAFRIWLDEEPRRSRCHYCGVDSETATWDDLGSWCRNCLLDLEAKGQWTGRAADALRAMWRREKKDDPRWEKLESLWNPTR